MTTKGGVSCKSTIKVLEKRLPELDALPADQRDRIRSWFDGLKKHITGQFSGTDSGKLTSDPDFPGGPVAWFAALSDITGSPNPDLSMTVLIEVLQSPVFPSAP
jgi:hypothetical protein